MAGEAEWRRRLKAEESARSGVSRARARSRAWRLTSSSKIGALAASSMAQAGSPKDLKGTRRSRPHGGAAGAAPRGAHIGGAGERGHGEGHAVEGVRGTKSTAWPPRLGGSGSVAPASGNAGHELLLAMPTFCSWATTATGLWKWMNLDSLSRTRAPRRCVSDQGGQA